MNLRASTPEHGFTLLEASVVLAILAVLVSIVVIKADFQAVDGRVTAARATMETIREAFVGSPTARGYYADMRYTPGFDPAEITIPDLLQEPVNPLAAPAKNPLLFDPITQRGWRGPYVSDPQLVANTNAQRRGFFPAPNDRRTPADTTFQARNFTRKLTVPQATARWAIHGVTRIYSRSLRRRGR